MRRREFRNNGFIIILVILSIFLISLEVLILTSSSSILLFESDKAYLRVVERNLAASGLAWAKRNVKSRGKQAFSKEIKLNLSDTSYETASLGVRMEESTVSGAEIYIKTLISQGRQTLSREEKYRITDGARVN